MSKLLSEKAHKAAVKQTKDKLKTMTKVIFESSKASKNNYGILADVPFNSFYLYQILAKKHNLNIHPVYIETKGEDILRINFRLIGEERNEKAFIEDTGLEELYLDKIDEIFGVKK